MALFGRSIKDFCHFYQRLNALYLPSFSKFLVEDEAEIFGVKSFQFARQLNPLISHL